MEHWDTSAVAHVDVWTTDLNLPSQALPRLSQVLSTDERARADRFHFERDARRFMVTRAALRYLLSSYLDADASAIKFEYGPYGKPALAAGKAVVPLHFNVSHSDDSALIAVTRFHEVGVDVEHIRGDFPVDEIAARFFGAAEVSSLHNLAPTPRRQRFYNLWTRKEAYSKARAQGLSLDPARIDASIDANAANATLHVRLDGIIDTRVFLYDLSIATEVAAALAVVGVAARIDVRSFVLP